MTIEDRVTFLENQIQEVLDVLEQVAKDLELVTVNITRTLKGIQPQKPQLPKSPELAAVTETTFTTLKFEPQQGAKIGDFEVAYKPNNIPGNWDHPYNILRINNATINNRYHGQGYQYSYWIYGEGKIYRQKLREKQ